MNQQRGRQRVKDLFADIEVLAVNPAGNTLEIHHELESPPAQIADLEKPLLEDENDEFGARVDSFENPQVEEHKSDELILHEKDQMDYADPHDKMETPRDSLSPLPEISTAIPPPSKSETQTIVDMPIAPAPHKPITADDLSPTSWQDVAIGAVTGAIVTGIILASTAQWEIFNNLGRYALLGWEVLCGIIGALVAKASKKTGREIWIGAIGWTVVPVWIVLLIILLIYALMFTNFFSV